MNQVIFKVAWKRTYSSLTESKRPSLVGDAKWLG